jgi:Cohesin domain/Dockerin type I domain
MRKSLFLTLLSLTLTASFAFSQDSLKVVSATAGPGSDVIIKIMSSVVETNVIAAEFNLNFDQAMLQIKETAEGADAGGLVDIAPDIGTANDSGLLSVRLVDSFLANPLVSGTEKELFLITFTIAADASGEIPIELTGALLVDTASNNIDVTVVNGSVTVGDMEPGQENTIGIGNATGVAGEEVAVAVTVTSDQDLVGAMFDVNFDKTKLQVNNVEAGADAGGVKPQLLEIGHANSSGTLHLDLLDYNLTDPLLAGTDKELLVITFTIGPDVTEAIPLTLTDVSLVTVVDDSNAAEVETAVVNGMIYALAPGDVNGDGAIDIFDLLGLLQILSGASESTVGSDVNADGKTNIFDLLALLSMLAA